MNHKLSTFVIIAFVMILMAGLVAAGISELVATKKVTVDKVEYIIPADYDIQLNNVLQAKQDRIDYLEDELSHLGSMPLPTTAECVSWCELYHPAYFEKGLKTVYEGELQSLKS